MRLEPVASVNGVAAQPVAVNVLVRLLWFVLIGWWLGALWFAASLVLMLSVVFFPIGAYAATKTWNVMTLGG